MKTVKLKFLHSAWGGKMLTPVDCDSYIYVLIWEQLLAK